MVTFVSTVVTGLSLIPYSPFLLEWGPIIYRFQIWRLVLNFFHLGRLGLGFLINLYFLYTYSQQLERGVFFGRPANYAWFLTLVAVFVMICTSVFPSLVNGSAILIAIIHLWGKHADNVIVSLYGFIKIPAKYFSLTLVLLDVIKGGFTISGVLGLLGGHLYYFLDSVYPTMPQGKNLIFVPIWFERLIDQIQNTLGSLTSLQRVSPVMQSGPAARGFGGSSRTGSASGRQSGAATTSGVRSGFTMPISRSKHQWGSGHALGSS